MFFNYLLRINIFYCIIKKILTELSDKTKQFTKPISITQIIEKNDQCNKTRYLETRPTMKHRASPSFPSHRGIPPHPASYILLSLQQKKHQFPKFPSGPSSLSLGEPKMADGFHFDRDHRVPRLKA